MLIKLHPIYFGNRFFEQQPEQMTSSIFVYDFRLENKVKGKFGNISYIEVV